jgi:hypothetical protein
VTVESAVAPPIAWATLEAPLVQFGNIFLPYAPFPPTIPPAAARPGMIYSWALNNLWDTNFPPAQGGEMTFRYAVSTEDGRDPRALGPRTAAGVAAPLVAVCGPRPGAAAPALPPRGSFAAVDHPEIEITHLAPSRRGHHLVIFLASTAAEATDARISFGLLPVARAWQGTFLERSLELLPVADNAVRLTVPPGAYLTISLDLADRP